MTGNKNLKIGQGIGIRKTEDTPCILAIMALLCMGIFLGCGPKIPDIEPPVSSPEAFSYSGSEVMPDRWWTAFEDESLNVLVDSALANNLDLAVIWQQFKAAEAVAKREGANLYPQIDASAQSAISRPEPDFAGGENVQLGLGASYEFDLWGRIRTAVQAEKFRATASLEDYRAAAISLSAELVLTWYRLVTAKNQLALAEEQIATNQNIIRLIRARFGSGQVRAVDILRQSQLLENTKDQRIVFATNVRLLENQLSILLGNPPVNNYPEAETDFPRLPEIPSTGLPLELVRRRPDVRSAYDRLLAADMDMASAVRNKYPRLTARLSGQLRANDFQGLFQNWAYSLGGNLLAPLLYGGRLRAEVDRNEAVKNQQLYGYGQTVLVAFREVEDALVQETNQKERIEILGRQLELADKTNRQLRLEFLNGISPYLDVLLALDQEQQLRRDMIEAESEQLEIRVALYRALAGGFETEETVVP